MAMRKIDTKLFVMCRLCLKDTGMYQILPHIQEKVKYCFDFDVNLFDGLPQLICHECNNVLDDYSSKKTTFIDNQVILRDKLNTQEIGDNKAASAAEEPKLSEADNEIIQKKPFHRIKKKLRLFSSSSSSEDLDKTILSPAITKKTNDVCSKTETVAWETKYKKRFICRFCKKRCKRKDILIKHIRKHDYLLARHNNVFKTICTVDLAKVDGKPNLTGLSSTVVFSHNKIMSNESMNYYVLYSLKADVNDVDSKRFESTKIKKDFLEDSSDDDIFIKRIVKKRPRLRTRSSNDTVVLDEESNKTPSASDNESQLNNVESSRAEPNVTDYISLDDSSDNASCKSVTMELRSDVCRNNTFKANAVDYKTIQNIISMCHKKYNKKSESCENDGANKYTGNAESQLKHKFLSMGRKIINKQGVNCTGLLRFMEHKNLEIKWTPKFSTTMSTKNYVRIMPKLKENETIAGDNLGWKDIPETESNELSFEFPINFLDNDVSRIDGVVPPCLFSSEPYNGHYKENKPLVNADYAAFNSNPSIGDNDVSLKNKLLNESPVAHPKQLPKKLTAIDTVHNVKTEEISLQAAKEIENCEDINVYLENIDNSDSNLSLPIITSTISLSATVVDVAREHDEITKTDTVIHNSVTASEMSVPRIKVKPVTELMSERVLKNLSHEQIVVSSNIWGINQNTNVSLPYQNAGNNLFGPASSKSQNNPSVEAPISSSSVVSNFFITNKISQSQINPPVQTPNSSVPIFFNKTNSALQNQTNPPVEASITPSSVASIKPAIPETSTREFFILNTVELPNTKTDSPFRYVKKLLQIYNIILLDESENISRDFVCLVRFRVQYKLEALGNNVLLFFSFECALNKFYLGLKHHEQGDYIDMVQLRANWQWEILNKIYSENVAAKILKNAQKVSPVVHEYTKSFICLLKSIEVKSIETEIVNSQPTSSLLGGGQ